MVFLSMLEQKRAMAPPARRERALTSSGKKPKGAPTAIVEARRAQVMCLALEIATPKVK
jgi:hypothetical protein